MISSRRRHDRVPRFRARYASLARKRLKRGKEGARKREEGENFVALGASKKLLKKRRNNYRIAECPARSRSFCRGTKPWEDKGRRLVSFGECGKNFFAVSVECTAVSRTSVVCPGVTDPVDKCENDRDTGSCTGRVK